MARRKKEVEVPKEKVFANFEEFLTDLIANNSFETFGAFRKKVVNAVEVKVENFIEDIRVQKETLDNTPLTRKEYEERLNAINNTKNFYKDFKDDSLYMQNRILMNNFIEMKVKENKIKDEKFVDSLFNYIWHELDFQAMLYFFNEYEYSESADVLDMNDPKYTDNNTYAFSFTSSDKNYVSMILNNIIDLKIENYKLKNKVG